jgi:hypothetical protein
MWYRITIRYRNNKIQSGIREVSHKNLHRIELMVFDAVKKTMAYNSISLMDITPLPDDHPEVQALLKSGNEVKELK